MDVYTTEDEQIAAMKKWWNENWMSLLGGVLIGSAVLIGGKYWLDSKGHHAEMASYEFETLVQALNANKSEQAAEKAALLLGEYVDTPYAGLASLAMAKIKTESDDLVAAKSHLRWAMDNATQDEVKHIAKIRMARVLLAEAKYDDALAMLNEIKSGPQKAGIEELKGDIYVAKGETEAARRAYNVALVALDTAAASVSSRARNFLQIKLDDLGETTAPIGES